MWNKIKTDEFEGMIAESVVINGCDQDPIHVYYARPMGPGPYPGIVLIPHMPGWDEWCRETSRRFAEHGYSVACPNIYERFGHGYPDEVSMRVREQGGCPDRTVMGDVQASLSFLRSQPNANKKVGVIGMCSGGRHAFLAACQMDFDAAVDCWGGGVIQKEEELSPARPKAPIDFAADLKCPLLGIFGNEDRMPTPDQVDEHERVLKELGKDYTFYRYDGAGHGFWYYHNQMYRQQQAMDSLEKVFDFFEANLRE